MAYPLVEKGLTNLTTLVIGQKMPLSRKCWEPSSPTTQCNSIIRPFEESDKICYICGMEIIKDASVNSNNNNDNSSNYEAKDGLNPECEHILPIAEAIIYLGLESPQFRNNPWYMGKEILKYEYAWAHRTCNQIKSDTSFIGKDNLGKYVVKIPELNKLLKAIWDTTRKDSVRFKSNLQTMYGDNSKMFIQLRTGQINDPTIVPATHKFQAICDYLNSFGAPNLLFLAGICSIANIDGQKAKFAREKQASLSPNYFQKLQEEKRNAKIAQATEDYTQIYNNTVAFYTPKVSPVNYPDVYQEFGRLAQQEFEFYIHLVLQLDDELYTKWIQFTNISLKQLFIKAYKNVKGENLPRVVIGLKRNAYAQVLPPNVQTASAAAPYSQGSVTGLAQWLPTEAPVRKLSLKAKASLNMTEKGRQRREEKAIQQRKNRREQNMASRRKAQSTEFTTNNNNKPANNNMAGQGGKRKTRKNRRN